MPQLGQLVLQRVPGTGTFLRQLAPHLNHVLTASPVPVLYHTLLHPVVLLSTTRLGQQLIRTTVTGLV